MTHNHTMCATRETPIGNQTDRLAIALPNQRCCNCEHFTHSRSPLGSFIANDDHVAMLNLVLHDGVKGLFLRVEYSSGSTVIRILEASDFAYCPFGSQIALENNEWAGGVEGVIERPY